MFFKTRIFFIMLPNLEWNLIIGIKSTQMPKQKSLTMFLLSNKLFHCPLFLSIISSGISLRQPVSFLKHLSVLATMVQHLFFFFHLNEHTTSMSKFITSSTAWLSHGLLHYCTCNFFL